MAAGTLENRPLRGVPQFPERRDPGPVGRANDRLQLRGPEPRRHQYRRHVNAMRSPTDHTLSRRTLGASGGVSTETS